MFLRFLEFLFVYCCEICYVEVLEINLCKYCVVKFCDLCKLLYDFVLKMVGELKDFDFELDGCDEDDELEDGGGIFLSRFIYFYEYNFGIKLIVKFLLFFKVFCEVSCFEEYMIVVCIFLKLENICLVIYE